MIPGLTVPTWHSRVVSANAFLALTMGECKDSEVPRRARGASAHPHPEAADAPRDGARTDQRIRQTAPVLRLIANDSGPMQFTPSGVAVAPDPQPASAKVVFPFPPPAFAMPPPIANACA